MCVYVCMCVCASHYVYPPRTGPYGGRASRYLSLTKTWKSIWVSRVLLGPEKCRVYTLRDRLWNLYRILYIRFFFFTLFSPQKMDAFVDENMNWFEDKYYFIIYKRMYLYAFTIKYVTKQKVKRTVRIEQREYFIVSCVVYFVVVWYWKLNYCYWIQTRQFRKMIGCSFVTY